MHASFLLYALVLAQGTPTGPRGVSDTLRFASITAGGHHACGLTVDGHAYCWGRNNAGQLGDSTTTDRATPEPVTGGITFAQIAAGAQHTCGVSTTNEVYCWGSNEHGQLGNGGRAIARSPFRVADDLMATSVAAGALHTCALLKHWEKEGRALCWGNNANGQLGTLDNEDAVLPSPAFGVIAYVSLAAGDSHTCGATTAGKVFCWGANDRGQLGNGSTSFSKVPFLTPINRKETFIKVVAGTKHSCGLTEDNEIYCWGENGAGQIGNGKNSGRALFPAWLKDPLGYTGLAAGGSATCALRRDGSVVCWGSNEAGQLGTAPSAGNRAPAPALEGVALKDLSLGSTYGCGIGPEGAASCWGTGP
jgi:alpha-tubulin suppressor-like RCC1 family protein